MDVHADVTDDVDPAPRCTITGVTSSEPDNGLGDGHVGPDSTMTGALTANVRAERAGNGPGRT